MSSRSLRRRQLQPQLAERLEERTVGQALAADVEAGPGEDARAGGPSAGSELRDEPGLAQTGVAADQDERRLALGRQAERVVQRGELGGSPDDLGAREDAGHRKRS